MVFEYVEYDLRKLLMKNKIAFTKPQIKYIFKQIMEGIAFMHKKKIMNRDIKSENILINKHGIVKIADFGLARDVHTDQNIEYGQK